MERGCRSRDDGSANGHAGGERAARRTTTKRASFAGEDPRERARAQPRSRREVSSPAPLSSPAPARLRHCSPPPAPPRQLRFRAPLPGPPRPRRGPNRGRLGVASRNRVPRRFRRTKRGAPSGGRGASRRVGRRERAARGRGVSRRVACPPLPRPGSSPLPSRPAARVPGLPREARARAWARPRAATGPFRRAACFEHDGRARKECDPMDTARRKRGGGAEGGEEERGGSVQGRNEAGAPGARAKGRERKREERGREGEKGRERGGRGREGRGGGERERGERGGEERSSRLPVVSRLPPAKALPPLPFSPISLLPRLPPSFRPWPCSPPLPSPSFHAPHPCPRLVLTLPALALAPFPRPRAFLSRIPSQVPPNGTALHWACATRQERAADKSRARERGKETNERQLLPELRIGVLWGHCIFWG